MTSKINNSVELVSRLRDINRECASKGLVQCGSDAQRWLNFNKQLVAAERRLKKLAGIALRDGKITIDEYSKITY